MKLRWIEVGPDKYFTDGTVKYVIRREYMGSGFIYTCGLDKSCLADNFKHALKMCQKYEDDLST